MPLKNDFPAKPSPKDDLDTPDDTPAEELAPRQIYVDAGLGITFGLYGASIEDIMQRVDSYKGPRHSHSLDGSPKKGRWPNTTAPDRADVIIKPSAEKTPHKAFIKAAEPPSWNEPKPDLTNDYLNRLIGWHREYERVNPRPSSKYVRIKTDGVWSISRTESWADIDHALRTRRRNVESPALSLKDHIHSMRLGLTPDKLGQLLDWFRERTHKDHCKHSTVWLKETSPEGRTVWTVAPYRWREVEREFLHADARQALGAETLQEFKNKRRAAQFDRLILGSGSPEGTDGPR